MKTYPSFEKILEHFQKEFPELKGGLEPTYARYGSDYSWLIYKVVISECVLKRGWFTTRWEPSQIKHRVARIKTLPSAANDGKLDIVILDEAYTGDLEEILAYIESKYSITVFLTI